MGTSRGLSAFLSCLGLVQLVLSHSLPLPPDDCHLISSRSPTPETGGSPQPSTRLKRNGDLSDRSQHTATILQVLKSFLIDKPSGSAIRLRLNNVGLIDRQSDLTTRLQVENFDFPASGSTKPRRILSKRSDLNPIQMTVKESEFGVIGKEVRRLQPLGASRSLRYSLKEENPWVELRPENGAVIVKKAFDYEGLDSSKSIDFFVLINDTHTGGTVL
jgi:hypothetical protein